MIIEKRQSGEKVTAGLSPIRPMVNRVISIAARLIEAAPYIFLACAALAPLSWFRDGLAIKGVDSYFSLHPAGRIAASFSLWDARSSTGAVGDEVAVGMINVVQGTLSLAGAPLPLIEAAMFLALSSAGLIGMYRLSRAILPTGASPQIDRWVAVATAIAWMVNPFALSFVWFHQLFIEVTWAVLPWLLLVVLRGIREEWPRRRTAAAVVLLLVLGSAGFLHAYLPGLILLLAIFVGAFAYQERRRGSLATIAVISFAFLVGLAWWLIPSLATVPYLVATASSQHIPSMTQLAFASRYSDVPSILTMTAYPILHQSAYGVPYISWAPLVLHGPGSVLVFVLPFVAIVGGAIGARDRKTRATAVAALVCLGIGIVLSKGLNQPLPGLNFALINAPLGEVFRHPLDKFALVVVPPLCLLFGFGLAVLSRHPWTGYLAPIAGVIVCGLLAIPWWTGSVIPSGGGLLPSAHVQVPAAYERVGSYLATRPSLGKTMVLPYSTDGGSAYRWPSGIQPNLDCLLQDWAPRRSLLCHDTGQQSADLLPDIVSQAVARGDQRVFDLARLSGIDAWLVHLDWDSLYMQVRPDPSSALGFLRNPTDAVPASVVSRDGHLVSFDPAIKTLRFNFRTTALPATDDKLLTFGTVSVQINRAASDSPAIYLGIYDSVTHLWIPGTPVSLGRWHAVELTFANGISSFRIDGVQQGRVLDCSGEDIGCVPTMQRAIPIPATLRSFRVLPADHANGTSLITKPTEEVSPDVSNSALKVLVATPELLLFDQRSVAPIYAGTSSTVVATSGADDLLSAAQRVGRSPEPVLVPPPLSGLSLDSSARSSWAADSATSIHGSLTFHGTTVLVFNQTFDRHWRLQVRGKAAVASHFQANGFANGWVVRGDGPVDWKIEYDLQPPVISGVLAGSLLLIAAATVLLIDGPNTVRKRRSPLMPRSRSGALSEWA